MCRGMRERGRRCVKWRRRGWHFRCTLSASRRDATCCRPSLLFRARQRFPFSSHVFGDARCMMSSNIQHRRVHPTGPWSHHATMASGTQSPPLEATGSHLPMGVSSIDGTCSKPMKDTEQRAGTSPSCQKGRTRCLIRVGWIDYFSEAVRRRLVIPSDGPSNIHRQVKAQYAECAPAQKPSPEDKTTRREEEEEKRGHVHVQPPRDG